LRLLLQLLEIVDYLHSQQLIHRDIRFPNIIVHKQRLHLIDFGLARYVGEEEGDEEPHPFFIEKKLRREIHVRSDFYALGHVLLFLLYTTFETPTETDGSWEEQLTLKPVPQKIIRKMLQLEPVYSSIGELRVDVSQAI
jgi:serine/threonine protein kinase, bacterial